MSNFWSKSGGIAVRSGNPLLCATCPCGTVCGACASYPLTWTLTLGNDYANASCNNSPFSGTPGNCTWLNNASFTLTYLSAGTQTNNSVISNGCYWESPLGTVVCTGGVIGGFDGSTWWRLSFQSAVWLLEFWAETSPTSFGRLMAFASISSAAFHCLAANTFTTPDWSLSTACTSASSATITP